MSNLNKNPFGETLDNPPIDPPTIEITNRNSTINIQHEPQIQVDMNNTKLDEPFQTFTKITRAELNRRQKELNLLKAEMDRRENILHVNVDLPPPNNWPPFSKKSCFQPCFYQDIRGEIPLEYQAIVMNLYGVWKLYILTLFVNVIGGFIIFFTSGKFTTFGISIINCLLLTPVSYLCWFRPAYNAFRFNSNIYFIIFFICYLFQAQITIYQTIGVPDTGNCGFQLAINQFSYKSFSKVFFGLVLLKIALCFAICSLANLVMLAKIFNTYRIFRTKHRTESSVSATIRTNNN